MDKFRILVGSYEHNLLCLSLDLTSSSQPVFHPIFHFQAHALTIRCIDNVKRYLVTGSNDEHIKIYDLQKRKELGDLLSHNGSITTLKFSANGKWLLSGSEDGQIIIWRVKDWELFGRLKNHKSQVNDLDIHPSGKIAISASNDNTLILWNLMTAKKLSILKLKGRDTLGQVPLFVKWNLEGDFFIVGFNTKIFIYNTANCKILQNLKFKSTLMKLAIAKFEDKEYLITGHNDGIIRFFQFDSLIKTEVESLDDIKPDFQFQGHTNRIKDFQIHGTHLVSISSDGKIVIWDLSKKDQVAVYDTGERLTCLTCCDEDVEKYVSRQKDKVEDFSEYETDNEEELKELKSQGGKRKKSKGKKKVTIEYE